MSSQFVQLPLEGGGGGGSGTVTSVGLLLPASVFNVSGSPVTTSGTLTGSFKNQTANTVLCGPTSGGAAAPAFRALVAADLPLAFGNLTDAGTDGITVTGGTGAVIGSGTSLSQHVADASHNGYLSSTDWNTFNGKAPTASPAFTTQVTFGNYHMEPGENNAGNSSTAQTIDWSIKSSQLSTLTGNVVYTFTNPQAGGAYVLRIATGAGSFTVTWPGSVLWAGGTAPTITATASKVDLINFYYDGTNYYGSFTQNY